MGCNKGFLNAQWKKIRYIKRSWILFLLNLRMNRFEITSSFDSIYLRGSKKEQQWELGHSQKCWVYIVLPRFEDSKDLQREDKARSGSRMGQGIWGTRQHWVRSSSWIFVAPLGWFTEVLKTQKSPWFFIAREREVYQGADFVEVFFWTCPSDLIWRGGKTKKSDIDI